MLTMSATKLITSNSFLNHFEDVNILTNRKTMNLDTLMLKQCEKTNETSDDVFKWKQRRLYLI